MKLVNIFLLILLHVLFFSSSNGDATPANLRRYKVCRRGGCTSLDSFHSADFMNMLLFLGRWSRWSYCFSDCSRYRYRMCHFPFLCGSAVIFEETFCFHRGNRRECQILYENYMEQSDSSLQTWSRSQETADEGRKKGNLEPTLNTHHFRQTPQSVFPRHSWNSTKIKDEGFSLARDAKQSQVSVVTPRVTGLNKETCGVARITDKNRSGLSMRILGGKETQKGRWPWQVAILNRHGESFCGGTLISSRWVVTAAHCVKRRIQVRIGEHHLHTMEGTERNYRIKTAFIHPQFDIHTVDNDIALLLLPRPAPTEAGVACLPDHAQELPPSGTLCTILGWGKERYNHVFGTSALHEGKIPLVSDAECHLTYDTSELTSNMFCGGYRNGTVDSCAGDSGGPLLCRQNGRWLIFGVTSFGEGCGLVEKYGIYAKVPNYVRWISKVITAMEESRDF